MRKTDDPVPCELTGLPLADVMALVGGREWRITAVQDQDALMREVRTDADLDRFPYGLTLWPSAFALAEWLADDPSLVRDRCVLELGTGVGLPGLVAAWRGAERVVQTDYQPAALALARCNVEQNGAMANISQRHGDWRGFPEDLRGSDVVLGSDVLYERGLHDDLIALLPRLVAPGGTVVLADPLRPQALSFVERLEAEGFWSVVMEGCQVAWENTRKDIALFFLRAKK